MRSWEWVKGWAFSRVESLPSDNYCSFAIVSSARMHLLSSAGAYWWER